MESKAIFRMWVISILFILILSIIVYFVNKAYNKLQLFIKDKVTIIQRFIQSNLIKEESSSNTPTPKGRSKEDKTLNLKSEASNKEVIAKQDKKWDEIFCKNKINISKEEKELFNEPYIEPWEKYGNEPDSALSRFRRRLKQKAIIENNNNSYKEKINAARKEKNLSSKLDRFSELLNEENFEGINKIYKDVKGNTNINTNNDFNNLDVKLKDKLEPTNLFQNIKMRKQPNLSHVINQNYNEARNSELGNTNNINNYFKADIEKSNSEMTINNFDIKEPITNSNTKIEIYKATYKPTNSVVVIKAYNKNQSVEENNKVEKEIYIHSRLRHKNIIEFKGFFIHNDYYALIFDYAYNRSLDKEIANHGTIPENACAKIIYQLLSALSYIHSLNIIHRNVQTSHLLVDQNLNIKLANFNQAITCQEINITESNYRANVGYLAPEIILNKNYDYTVDVWATAVICHELLTGYTPFEFPVTDDYDVIKQKIVDINVDYYRPVSKHAKNFLDSILIINPQVRPSAKYSLDHPWIKLYK